MSSQTNPSSGSNSGGGSSVSTGNTTTAASNAEVKNGFQVPKWAGKPQSGLHLDVMKEGKMIQKLMIDEKKYYFFGRNKDTCDFVIDHASCSRVHAVLLWHKHLNRSFLIDLDSTHGTFIGSIRLEPSKPQQVFVDSELKFGASTRTYIIRERPQINKHFPSILQSVKTGDDDNEASFDEANSSLQLLPESEAELDNLTEFNTAHNKRIAQLVDITSSATGPNHSGIGPSLVKRKKKSVTFNDEEDVINPEDIDPSIGRFRNMIQTSIIISKKKRSSDGIQGQASLQQKNSSSDSGVKRVRLNEDDDQQKSNESSFTLYDNEEFDTNSSNTGFSSTTISNLGIQILDIAPDVDNYSSSSSSHHQTIINRQITQQQQHQQQQVQQHNIHELTAFEKKKKYAKESWPGRHPGTSTSSNPNSSLNLPSSEHNVSPVSFKSSNSNTNTTVPANAAPTAANLAGLATANPNKRLII